MAGAAILDIDGTLVDTNYQHVIAWDRAFRAHGVSLPVWKIHRHIGMGGDQLVPALAGEEVATELGDDIRASEKERYAELVGEVRVLDGARELLAALAERGTSIVLASSAKEEEVDRYLDMLDAREVADAWTTSADVDATKPEPDLVRAALAKTDGGGAVMVGDTVWDVEAAGRAGIGSIGVLTGGFAAAELRGAGALEVYESVLDLAREIDSSPLVR